MRNWQSKTDNTAPATTGILSAAEDNARGSELTNAVSTSGITPDAYNITSDTDLYMLAQALARYASGGRFGTDTGSANAHVVGKTGNFKPPKAYFHGMEVMWFAAAANNGPATLNAWTVGSKKLLAADGTALAGGEIQANMLVGAIYDSAADGGSGAFRLYPWVTGGTPPGSGTCTLTATRTFSYTGSNQTWTPAVGTTYAVAFIFGAGGGGGANAQNNDVHGGAGGFSRAAIANPSGSYIVVVGGAGQPNSTSSVYGGGGPGGNGARVDGASGGGYSGIFSSSVAQGNALAVAGGGGGGGSTYSNVVAGVRGGGGGGAVGQAAMVVGYGSGVYGGQGGTQSAGGAAGSVETGAATIGTAGSALQGGTGAAATGSLGDGSGGGGGGYYGGGGGGNADDDGSNDWGGGGGSSYGAPGLSSYYTEAATYATPGGTTQAQYQVGIGAGGQGPVAGGNGLVVILEYTGTCP